MKRKNLVLTVEHIRRYVNYLREQERAAATIQKYAHDLSALLGWLDGQALTKAALIVWKEELAEAHAPATVNSMIAAVNGFFKFMDWRELTVKPLKIQRSVFCDEHRELTREEYARLVRAAERKENQRLALILQTICATGIRVSELKFITVEAVQRGRAEVSNKGKRRTVFLPDKLRRLLKKYLQAQKKTAGAVFTTRTGKPLDRSNIWRDMKALCKSAGVEPGKVFPHNLRHLFARTYYSLEKDLSRLADILGHSSIETTRIYVAASIKQYEKVMNRMNIVVDEKIPQNIHSAVLP